MPDRLQRGLSVVVFAWASPAAASAKAIPIEVRISGLLTGSTDAGLNPLLFPNPPSVTLEDAPFEMRVRGESDLVTRTGMIAGVGRAWILDGDAGEIDIDGLGVLESSDLQIFSSRHPFRLLRVFRSETSGLLTSLNELGQ